VLRADKYQPLFWEQEIGGSNPPIPMTQFLMVFSIEACSETHRGLEQHQL
jgi:hypothetical protein